MKRAREVEWKYLAASDRELTRLFLSLPEYRAAKTVMCYCGKFPEPDTTEIMESVLRDGKILALPLIVEKGVMEARRVKALGELMPGAYGINEPPEEAELIAPEELDVILVPAAAFARNGHRLGRGGGYYDRYLSATGAFTVGLSRERLILEEVPTSDHDVPVMLLITEKGIVEPEKGLHVGRDQENA